MSERLNIAILSPTNCNGKLQINVATSGPGKMADHRIYEPGSAEGLTEARRRIAEAAKTEADTLDLGGLGLVDLTPLLDGLPPLPAVHTLNLGPAEPVREMPYFERTEADKKLCNAVETLPAALFDLFPRLQELDLDNNRLAALPESIGRMAGLQRLWLAYNQLTALPESIGQMAGLERLWLDGNPMPDTFVDDLRRRGFGNVVEAIQPSSKARFEGSQEKTAPQPIEPRHEAPLMSDQRARRDSLKRQHLTDSVTRKLRALAGDPETHTFMLLLEGRWGSGKSTILGFIMAALKAPSSPSWVFVEFDAWRQAHVGPAWWGLLNSLRYAVRRELPAKQQAWLRMRETWRLSASDFGFAWLVVVLAIAGLLFVAFSQASEGEGWRAYTAGLFEYVIAAVSCVTLLWTAVVVARKYLSWGSSRGAKLFEDTRANPMGDLAKHFDWLLAQSPGPVLFVIDDLDRCDQQYVVDLLDAVQTLLRNPAETGHPKGGSAEQRQKLFFIVAADGRWIRRSYEVAHGDFEQTVVEPGRPLGYLFLEKLFQVTVPVPAMGAALKETYLRELVGDDSDAETDRTSSSDGQATLAEKKRRIEESSTQEEVLDVLRDSGAQREELVEDAVERLGDSELAEAVEHFLTPYAAMLDPNPRSIKRFVMAYNFTRDARLLEGLVPDGDALARWLIVHLRWPALAEELRNRPEIVDRIIGATDDAEGDDKLGLPKGIAPLLRNKAVKEVLADLTSDRIRHASGFAD